MYLGKHLRNFRRKIILPFGKTESKMKMKIVYKFLPDYTVLIENR